MTALLRQLGLRVVLAACFAAPLCFQFTITPMAKASSWKHSAPVNGSWSTASNWDGGVPAAGDFTTVVHTDGVPRTVNYDYTGPPVTLQFLEISLTGGVSNATTTFFMPSNDLSVSHVNVGSSNGGSGTFIQTGGINLVRESIHLSYGSGSQGTYELSNLGSLIVIGDEFIGWSGRGTFMQSGGIHSIATGKSLIIGYNVGSFGDYDLSGGTLASSRQVVGHSGTGSFNQTGGTNTLNGSLSVPLVVGDRSGSIGIYNLAGDGYLNAFSQAIGVNGMGTFDHTGGTNVSSDVSLGTFSTGKGFYNLSESGSLIVNGFAIMSLGYIGSGTLNQTGGTLSMSASIGRAHLNIAEYPGSSGFYDLTGGSATINGGVTIGGYNTTPGGSGKLDVGGSGVLNISDSLLVLNSTGSIATLSGGTINAGAIDNQGTFTINRGTLTVGDVTLNSTSIIAIGLGGLSRGAQYGAIPASGNVSLGGSLIVSLNGFTPMAGNSFDILDWGSLAGTFSTVQLPSLSAGLMWNASQLYTAGILTVNLTGDYSGNGTVDAADYAVWRNTLGLSGVGLAADGNGNSTVDSADYEVWKAHFGQSITTASTRSNLVPEPATWIPLSSVIAMMALRRSPIRYAFDHVSNGVRRR